jgi:murein DD-endopeptidase MepM/ murein hydrolase activator NlpD
MAYHVKEQADVKAVAACVKKLKFDEWNEALRTTFNGDSVIRIRVEKGLFKKGDNKLIDREVFKQKDVKVDSVKGYPIDATYGKLLKKPQDYTDVRGLVTADLQDEMEQLKQVENELRQMTGMAPAQDANAPAAQNPDASGNGDGKHDGQGGPVVQPDLNNIGQVLTLVEQGITQRRESLMELQQHIKDRQEKLGYNPLLGGSTTPSIWPAHGDVSSPFGLRWNGSDLHPGIDIANDAGTPILATADGVVTTAGWNDGGYGNMVDIDHGNGIMTRYGHAMQVVVTPGQYVRRGQVIAYMGSTGFSTGPHVHYEVRIGGEPVNPASYLH